MSELRAARAGWRWNDDADHEARVKSRWDITALLVCVDGGGGVKQLATTDTALNEDCVSDISVWPVHVSSSRPVIASDSPRMDTALLLNNPYICLLYNVAICDIAACMAVGTS
jgi:hypothetical protein